MAMDFCFGTEKKQIGLCSDEETSRWRRGLSLDADMIIILNTVGDKGVFERDNICQGSGPVYEPMPALPAVNLGALHTSGRCRPNTRATEKQGTGQ